MENIREYRKGMAYRSGDISEKDFCKELKFSFVHFGSSVSDEDKKKCLNYTYDAFKDLAGLFFVTPDVLSLQNKEGKKPNILFGDKAGTLENMFVNLSGDLVKHWVIFLDRFMGYSEGLDDGLSNNLLNNTHGFYAHNLKELIQILKKKNVSVMQIDSNSDEIKVILSEINNNLNLLPLNESSNPSVIMEIEGYRDEYLKCLNKQSLFQMIMVFEENGLEISSDVKSNLINLQNQLDVVKETHKKVSMEIVDTDFYKMAKEIDLKLKNRKYSDNLHLFACASNYYIEDLLKQQNRYNNFLVTSEDRNELVIPREERFVILEAVKKFYNSVIPYIAEQLSYMENEDAEIFKEEIEQRVDKIDEEIANDKGKFKLTYFKTLAQQAGFNPDMTKTEKGIGGCYYIYFKDRYISYVRPSIYNHPKDKNHKVDIYCGEGGKAHLEYWWDYDLDYNNFIEYLLNIEKENAKEFAAEEKESENRYKKFRLDDFKKMCLDRGLKVSRSKSQVLQDKYYRIDFDIGESGVRYLIAPIQIDVRPETQQRIHIKTTAYYESFYHYWNGMLDYEELINKLLEINKKYNPVKSVEVEDKTVSANIKDIKDNKFSYSDIKTTKDLRDYFSKVVLKDRNRLDYLITYSNVSGVLISNVAEKDSISFVIDVSLIADRDLKGNSKAWNITKDNILQVSSKVPERKKIEGLIEGFVNLKLKQYNANKVKKQMVVEGVTYLLCKMVGLDVRTYCINNHFENLINSGETNVESYIKSVLKVFKNLYGYF